MARKKTIKKLATLGVLAAVGYAGYNAITKRPAPPPMNIGSVASAGTYPFTGEPGGSKLPRE